LQSLYKTLAAIRKYWIVAWYPLSHSGYQHL